MSDYCVITLGDLLNEGLDENLIHDAFQKFSCSRETDLENFLNKKAILYEKTNFGKTYLVVDSNMLYGAGELSVMAYFTIAQKAVGISMMSKAKKRKVLGEYPGRDGLNEVPAYLVGQLGRSDTYSSSDISGYQILNECYHAISVAARAVGGNLVVLECREHMYDKFYKEQGFKKLYEGLNEENLYTLYKHVNFSDYWNKKRS